MTEQELCKKLLCEFLDFLKYKIEHDALTLEEELAMLRVFERSIRLSATSEDLSRYFGKSEVAVRSVISRRMMTKPRRRVLHDFREFVRVMPDKWRR